MDTQLATIVAIVSNDAVKKSNAVVWLEGDGLSRMDEVMRVFRQGLADYIVVSGGLDDGREVAIPAPQLAEELYQRGVSKEKVIIESVSQNTFEQATEVMKIAAQKGWKKIILVASHYHQLRAYLTFLQAMKNTGLKIEIYNSPARDLAWFEKIKDKNRAELFEGELQKIEAYSAKGHVARVADALMYQAWKEKQG
ncbi:MAG: YdcF family protein [Patescibacteria group bacterium]